MTSTPAWADELARFEAALSSGDVPHALTHLGAALAEGPHQERVHASLEAFAAQHSLLETKPGTGYVGEHLLHAWALQRAARLDEAVQLMSSIVVAIPGRGYELMLASWLAAGRAGGRSLAEPSWMATVRAVVTACAPTVGLHLLEAGERELLSGYEALADELLEAPMSEARWAASGVYRRLGRFDKALQAVGDATTYFALVQRGLAQRASGDAQAALDTFLAAKAMSGASDQSDDFEVARCLFLLGDGAAALERLEGVPADGNPETQGLLALCRELPAERHVGLLDALRRSQTAPRPVAPPDATANIFAQHRDKLSPGSAKVRVRVSGWESPSNRLLVALFAGGSIDLLTAEYSGELAGNLTRDPMAQVQGAAAPTWRQEGGLIFQASSPPPPELRGALGAVSVGASDFPALWQGAGALAAAHSPTPHQVMAAMVNPPVDRTWLETLPAGLYWYQLACACTLVQLPRPWPELRAACESLLFGPIDWSSGATVSALAEKVRRDAAVARDGLALLCAVVGDLLERDTEPRAAPLIDALTSLPGVPQDVLERLRAHWQPPEDEGGEAGDAASPASPAAAPAESAPTPRASGVPSWVQVLGLLAALAAVYWLFSR